MIRAYLYDAEGQDREVELTADLPAKLAEHRILWIDVTDPQPGEMEKVAALLPVGAEVLHHLARPGAAFALDNYGDYFHCDVLTVLRQSETAGTLPNRVAAGRMDFIVAPQWLITVHAQEAPFLAAFREQDKGETLIGALTGPQLAASLLDWHLEVYLKALEDFERYVDALDVRILARRRPRESLLGQLVQGRRYVSVLRRTLAPQRSIFYGASRPDFTHVANTEAAPHFAALERRFERTLDAIDHGRELMQSSFDLFTTRTAETTNMLIRRLTFLSVTLGGVSATACLLAMNVPQPFADVANGFWIVVGTLVSLAVAGGVVGRLRKWI